MDIIQLVILTSGLLVVDFFFFFPEKIKSSLVSMLMEKNRDCPDVVKSLEGELTCGL